jgi:asparagine synthase (glutamine-hydrolysing)
MHDGIVQDQAWATLMMPPETLRSVGEDLWLSYFTLREWDRLPLRLLHVLHQTWLISNCLALADRLSMAHSIEMRLPLLDTGLVDLVTGLREAGVEDWKQPHKWLLTESVRDVLPEEVLSRPKQGFTPPGIEWYMAVEQHYGHLLEQGTLMADGLLEPSKLADVRRSAPLGFRYKLILLEVWCRLLVREANWADLVSGAAPADARAA